MKTVIGILLFGLPFVLNAQTAEPKRHCKLEGGGEVILSINPKTDEVKVGILQKEGKVHVSSETHELTYAYLLRGGGPENHGVDLNYLRFVVNKMEYVVYEEYVAEVGKNTCGLHTADLSTEQFFSYKGKYCKKNATLVSLRDNKTVKHSKDITPYTDIE